MRRIMLTVALVLWASQIEAAVLFPPDAFRLDVTAVFNDTNTNTFCWQCGDSNPLNDFQAVLQSFPDLTDAWTDFLPYAGSIHLQGTATDYLGLDANFSLRVRFTAWGASLPESLVRPSVSDGIIPGRILGVEDGLAIGTRVLRWKGWGRPVSTSVLPFVPIHSASRGTAAAGRHRASLSRTNRILPRSRTDVAAPGRIRGRGGRAETTPREDP